jgi:Spx/MgsR family transcriptional regulator
MNPTPPALAVVHGIPNCDTVKKARTWLLAQRVAYSFHDFKKAGVPEELPLWVQALGWEALLNRRGSTWRALSPAQQAAVVDAPSAMALMRSQPSVIKRPVLHWADGVVTVGFDPAVWAGRAQQVLASGADR